VIEVRTLVRHARRSFFRLCHELEKELRRLNSARLGDAELSRLAPRERSQTVKQALDKHHRESARCC